MTRGPLEPIAVRAMDRDDVGRVADLHGHTPALTPTAFAYEYFENPDAGSILFVGERQGALVASQAFVAQALISNNVVVPTLMSERTLLSADWRGQLDFTAFYAAAMDQAFQRSPATFVWGGTAAVKPFARYGFTVTDCFTNTVLVLSPRRIVQALVHSSGLRSKLGRAANGSLGWARHVMRRRWRRLAPFAIAKSDISSAELTELYRRLCAAHPEIYFFHGSRAKLRWLVDDNPFRRRESYAVRDGETLIGLVVLEWERFSCTLVDIVLPDVTLAPDVAAHFARIARERGASELSFFGNGLCPYVRVFVEALTGLGAASSKSTAQLVVRSAPESAAPPPSASVLAFTSLWAPPA